MMCPGPGPLEPALAIRDRHIGPTLLAPFADDMARRLARFSLGPLLEIAADIGVLTQAIASVMSAGAAIIATDPDASAVHHASLKPGMARVTWQTADPRALPFNDAAFGVVACLFGVTTMPNRVQAFREVRRVMKPGGRFLFAVPAHIRHNPVAECVQDAVDALFPSDPLRFLASVLHGYADNEMIDNDLTAAGFTDAVYTTVDLSYVARSARDTAIGFCLGTPLRGEIEDRLGAQTGPAVDAVTQMIIQRFGSGEIAAPMRAQVVSASG